ncbi:hypothetical protein DL764_009776 [Monosporascus ibericus]|uniref:Uncharacterized protein n=1 Tax=Monosporascus ibericus TaxID=155417 RepID=A0A4Q4SWG2_9PEZI|nr:hypothetical protein DL764_009776 [Monosporascus ibericus]
MYTLYLSRLPRSRLTGESKRLGMFVAVGSAGYTSATLAALGMDGPRVIPPEFLSIDSDMRTGDLWKAFAIPTATFIWLLDFWFFALAVCACLRGSRHMEFSLDWLAFVFPSVELTTGTVQIADAIGSSAVKGVAVWQKKVLWPGKDVNLEGLDDQEVSYELRQEQQPS